MVETVSARVSAAVRRSLWPAAVGLIGLVLVAGRAPATVVVAKDFAALCAESDLIFVGTVTEVASRWRDPSQQAIETLVSFADLTWLRGAPQSSVTLHFAGGTVGDVREEVAGVPRFAVGERRMIFAHEGRFVSPIVGFDQGALRVVDGPDGPLVVGVDGTGASGPPDAALRLGSAPDAVATPVSLDAFLDSVRRELAAPSHATP